MRSIALPFRRPSTLAQAVRAAMLCLPLATLDRLALQSRLDEIGRRAAKAS